MSRRPIASSAKPRAHGRIRTSRHLPSTRDTHSTRRVRSAYCAQGWRAGLRGEGLMAGYCGGMELLADLRNAARRAGDLPHGLWLLCPTDAIEQRPRLDRQVVESEPHEWIQLSGLMVQQMADTDGAARAGSNA